MADSSTYDETTMARRYAMAQKLMEPSKEPIKSWTQGLSNMANSALGGWQIGGLDAERKAEKEQERADLYKTLGLPAPAAAAEPPGMFSRIGALLSGGGSPAGTVSTPDIPTPAATPVPPPAVQQATPTMPVPTPAPPVPPPAPAQTPVEPIPGMIRTNPDGSIAGNVTAPMIATPGATKIAAALSPPSGPTDVSAIAKPPAVATAPGLMAGIPDDKKAQIATMLTSHNPTVKALGTQLMNQAMAASDTPKYDFKTAGDSLYRTNAKTGTAEPIRDVGRSIKPMSDDERKQWKVPEGVAAGIDDNGKPVFSQPSAVNTVSPVVSGINERFDAQMKAAQAAPAIVTSIHEARRALDAGAITGAGADQRLFLSKIGTLFGLPNEAVANTETARAALGNQVLESAKTLGANPSNADRDYIEKVKGGSIALDETSMRRLMDIQEKLARTTVDRANDVGKKLVQTDPEKLGRFAPMLQVDQPPTYEEHIKNNPAKVAAPTIAAPDKSAIEAEMRKRGLLK